MAQEAMAREATGELEGAALAGRGAQGVRGAARHRLGGDALRPIHFADFMLAKKTIRVSVSKKSADRDVLMKWHERFGEGTAHKDVERLGF